jgi:DNA-binding FadR family transcriptional regulator
MRIRRPKVATIVADAIAEEIFRRDLAPGVVLSTEARMMERFGVGRGTIREALRLLEAEGLVSMRSGPRGGAVVQQPGTGHLARLLSILLTISGATLHDVFEARLLIEPELARKAALNATESDLERLAAAVDHQSGCLPADAVDAGGDFHSILAEASQSRALGSFWAAIRRIVDGQQLGVHYRKRDLKASVSAHARIVEAIQMRDPERAAASMRRHIVAHEGYLKESYGHVFDERIRVVIDPDLGKSANASARASDHGAVEVQPTQESTARE